jgi:16S rRNA processing protein RimM
LAAELDTEDPELLARVRHVALWNGAQRRPAQVVGVRRHGDRLLLRFEGVNGLSDAEKIAGWEVQVAADQLEPAPPGSYYVADLVGCRVREAGSCRLLGSVKGWLETGATPLLEVSDGKREVLVPFAAAICIRIDPAAREILVRLPEGLEDLNHESAP